MQEAWTRLSAKGGVRDRAQLFVTIKRLFIDQYRRGRVVEYVPLTASNVEHLPHGFATESSVDQLDDVLALERALNSLRIDEREAMYLSFVEGYTAKEVGELVGKPRNTVLSLVHRAKAKLSMMLTSTHPPKTKRCAP